MDLNFTMVFDGSEITINLADITVIEFKDKLISELIVWKEDKKILELKSNSDELKDIHQELKKRWNKFKYKINKFKEIENMIEKYEKYLKTFNKVTNINRKKNED